MRSGNNEKITLEWVALEKEKKLKEIHLTKDNIKLKAGQLLGPRETRKSGVEGIMKNFSTALVVYDGIKLGIGLMKRLRSTFGIRK